MGSSKKHKEKDKDREHKHKRRHRSRSRSPSSKDKVETKHRKHKREKSRERDDDRRRRRYSDERDPEPAAVKREIPPDRADDHEADGEGAGLALSVGQTNKLRAKLGLKPLDVPGGGAGEEGEGEDGLEDGEIKPMKQDPDVHVPAVNIHRVKQAEALRQKMLGMKEKRRVNTLLGKVKTLGEESDEEFDNAAHWVKKNRKVSKEKAMADRQAKLLEEMDKEFGIGDLVEEEFHVKKPSYTSKHLKGLNVQHSQDSFKEGKTVILTLKDKGVLDEDDEETLMNVNMLDDEKAAEFIDNKKKKPDYQAYDEADIDEYGVMKPKDVLQKYDDEIQGKKQEKFQLGAGGKYDAEHERRMQEIKLALRQQGQSLDLPAPMLAREFYTQDEVASFNRVKKKVPTATLR